ncbi:MAG: peptidoglycan-binding protein [bacterium]|nr:peptidoglycan-binding protein [bacterium]
MEPQQARLTFVAFLALSGFIVFNALFMQKDAEFMLRVGTDNAALKGNTSNVLQTMRGNHSFKGDKLHIAIRRELSQLQYFPGARSSRLDGRLDAMTMGAIMAYQYDLGLPVDGVASNTLLKSMLFGATKSADQPKTMPQMGLETRQLVAEIQGILSVKGHYRGKIDGIFKGQTIEAVKRFERRAGLPVTGRVSGLLVQELTRRTGVAFSASQK